MKSSNYKYLIMITLIVCGISNIYFQFMMTPVSEQIKAMYNLNQVQYSTLFTAPMAPAIFISLICGIIIDRFGARKVVLVSLIVASCGIWGRVFTTNFAVLYICMMVPGFAATFLNTSNAKLYGEWFDPSRISTVMGIHMGMSSLGNACAIYTTAMLPSVKTGYVISAVISTAAVLLWLFFYRSNAEKSSRSSQAADSVVSNIKTVFRTKDIIIAGIALLCSYGCFMSVSTFCPQVLQYKGFSAVTAGKIAAVVSLGQCVGNFTSPLIAARVGNLKKVLIGMTAVSVLSIFSITFAGSAVLLVLLLFLAGYAGGGVVPLYLSMPVKLKQIGTRLAGTAGGTIATFELAGAVLIPSYVIAAIAGDRMNMYYVLAPVIGIISILLLTRLSHEVELQKS